MAHYLNDSIMEGFRLLKKASSADTQVQLLYDNSKGQLDTRIFQNASEYFSYDIEDLVNRYPLMNPSARSLIPGNCIFPMLLFAQTRTDFEYLWRVEYDARFSGDWNLFFDYFAQNKSDLLGTTLFRYDFRPEWNWWSSLKSPFGDLEKDALLRGYFPVIRLSRRAVEVLQEAYRSGWRGHEEVAIPTILNFYRCSMEDIGGDGEFVKPENRNRFYTNTPAAPGLAPGTFVYRSNQCTYPDVPNMLYHPVKE